MEKTPEEMRSFYERMSTKVLKMEKALDALRKNEDFLKLVQKKEEEKHEKGLILRTLVFNRVVRAEDEERELLRVHDIFLFLVLSKGLRNIYIVLQDTCLTTETRLEIVASSNPEENEAQVVKFSELGRYPGKFEKSFINGFWGFFHESVINAIEDIGESEKDVENWLYFLQKPFGSLWF